VVAQDKQRSDDAFAVIAQALLGEPDVEEGTGFGTNPGLRVRGKIFAMLFHDELVLKLPAERSTDLVETGAASRFTVGKRHMREWVALGHGGELDWTELAREALTYVRG
jgi:YjbR